MGSNEMTGAIEKLAVYVSNVFLLTSNTLAPVVKDVDLTEDISGENKTICVTC